MFPGNGFSLQLYSQAYKPSSNEAFPNLKHPQQVGCAFFPCCLGKCVILSVCGGLKSHGELYPIHEHQPNAAIEWNIHHVCSLSYGAPLFHCSKCYCAVSLCHAKIESAFILYRNCIHYVHQFINILQLFKSVLHFKLNTKQVLSIIFN